MDFRLVVFLLFLSWRAGIIVYRLWFHPLSHFPGPFLGRVSSIYRTYWFFQGNEQENQVRLHEKYGPIVRYNPWGLIVRDPTLLPVIYHIRADKTDFNAANFGQPTTFSLKSYKDHAASKRRISPAYSLKNMREFEPQIDVLLTVLIRNLKRASVRGKSIDGLFNLHMFNFDVITRLCFGRPLGFLDQARDVDGLIEKFSQTLWLGEFLAVQENLSWYIRNTRIGRYLMGFLVHPTQTWGIGGVMKIRDQIIDTIVDSDGEIKGDLVEDSLLGRFLKAKNGDGSPMSMQDVRNELLVAVQAGSETTSLNLALAVFYIARDPDVQRRLQDELDKVVPLDGDGTGPSPMVTYDQARQLPYLSACIRESLRYTPSIAQIPRASPADTGLDLLGKYVPPGTAVSTSAWIVGRDPALYGSDANVFRPSRWLEADPDLLKQWDRLDFTFGYGARKCLGRHLAMIQLWKAVAEIFRRFNVEALEPDNLQKCGVPLNWHIVIRPRATSAAIRH